MPDMNYRRWYPTATTLHNGKILVVAGQQYGAPTGATPPTVQAEIPEVYDPTTNTWQQVTTAARRLPLYPWMFQAPDGRVFNAGPNARTGFLNLDITTLPGHAPGTWQDGPLHLLGGSTAPAANYEYSRRGSGTAVMYAPGKILIVGGDGTNPATGAAEVANTAEFIDLNQPNPAWQSAGTMHHRRFHANATLLADGTVLVTGGNQEPTTQDAAAALPAELWTPPMFKRPAGTWTRLNAMSVPRLYHSAAVLLPDATVLSVGGGQGGGYQDHPDYEIFTPPYLCQGSTRPVITTAPAVATYGSTFTVSTPGAGNFLANGGRATLVRLSSVTHSFNMNQRFLELPLLGSAGNTLSLQAPANAYLCPPGHYMLFLIAPDGTPSMASILALRAGPCSAILSVSQQDVPTNDACQKLTRFTASGGTGVYNWTVNGVAQSSTAATLDVSTRPGKPTLAVLVEESNSSGCGATASVRSFFPECPMPQAPTETTAAGRAARTP